jgi:hypothetical protein
MDIQFNTDKNIKGYQEGAALYSNSISDALK